MITPQSGPVAVTGATGFIGSHVVRVLLERGFTVRACVRNPSDTAKLAYLQALTEGQPGTLSFVRGDLLEAGSYDAAFAGAVAVVHTAAAVILAAPDPQKDIVDPSLVGTRNVLDAITRAGTVKRLVHTSSVSAIVSRGEPGRVYTEADWSDEATLKTDPYGFAKREAERLTAAVTGLSVVRLNPSMVFGPVMTKAHSKASASVIWDMLNGTFPALPAFCVSVVDVREVAEAHVQALVRPEAEGRYIISADAGWMVDLAKMLAEALPEYKIKTGRLPGFVLYLAAMFDKRMSVAMVRNLLNRPQRVDNQRSRTGLGITYRPVRDTLVDCARSLVDQGFVKPKRR